MYKISFYILTLTIISIAKEWNSIGTTKCKKWQVKVALHVTSSFMFCFNKRIWLSIYQLIFIFFLYCLHFFMVRIYINGLLIWTLINLFKYCFQNKTDRFNQKLVIEASNSDCFQISQNHIFFQNQVKTKPVYQLNWFCIKKTHSDQLFIKSPLKSG